MSTALDVLAGGWQLAGINTVTPGEMVTLTYSPAAAFQVSAITNDFSGANNYRPNVTCDPYAPRPAVDHALVQHRRACRSRPIRASRSATRRATTCADPTSGSSICAASKNVALGDRRAVAVPARGVQSVQSRELHAAGGQPQQLDLRHHHRHLRSASAAAGREGVSGTQRHRLKRAGQTGATRMAPALRLRTWRVPG